MAHFAKINENNIVEQVIVLGEVTETEGQEYIQNVLGLEGRWLQTSYNNNIRYNFAGIDFTYDETNDAFIAPKPFNSWILKEDFRWHPPIDQPEGQGWYWDEDTLQWNNFLSN